MTTVDQSERTFVYAGECYGSTHEVIRREGRHVWVRDSRGREFRVHKCDTDLVHELEQGGSHRDTETRR